MGGCISRTEMEAERSVHLNYCHLLLIYWWLLKMSHLNCQWICLLLARVMKASVNHNWLGPHLLIYIMLIRSAIFPFVPSPSDRVNQGDWDADRIRGKNVRLNGPRLIRVEVSSLYFYLEIKLYKTPFLGVSFGMVLLKLIFAFRTQNWNMFV